MKVHGVHADKVDDASYLGDIIRQDGKNTSNVKSRENKGMGIVTKSHGYLEGNQLQHMLQHLEKLS